VSAVVVVLMNKRVRLDIADLSANGQDSYGRLFSGGPQFQPPFSGQRACRVRVFHHNEFDLQYWRSEQSLQAEAGPPQGLGQKLQQNLQEDLCLRRQESAGKEQDRAAKEGWDWLKGQIVV
jgi:hypothetical protein